MDSAFKFLSKNVKEVQKNSDDFLIVQKSAPVSKLIPIILKKMYDLTTLKDTQNKSNLEILSELVVEALDPEQIWQLIELRNNVVFPQLLESTSKLLSIAEIKLHISGLSHAENEENSSNASDSENDGQSQLAENDSDGSALSDGGEDHASNEPVKKQKIKIRPSVVDDKFFKLSEMEAFLKAEDEKELNRKSGKPQSDDYSINYFDENLSSEEEENVCYKDFFDEENELHDNKQIKSSKVANDQDEEDEGDEEDGEDEGDEENEVDEEDDEDKDEMENNISDSEDVHNDYNAVSNSETSDNEAESKSKNTDTKSPFEDRQDRLKQRIRDYEQEILGEKPWQLKGEIQSASRPKNSLLEEILEFEATTRPAPIITEETTLRLEDIIRQRIKDKAWDDVELKVKPINTPQEYRKQLVLDQEKSKESLAKIYEKQYEKELEKLETNPAEAKEEEPRLHKEIKEMMRSLFIKLDALSNFHFTPKPVAPEPKIITNSAAVNMEEVAPVAMSDARLLAPEEVKKRMKGDIIGSNERNKVDKKRDRRRKKQKQKAIYKAFEERDIQKQKLGIPLSKKQEQAKISKNLTKNRNVEKISVTDTSAMKSSKAFFSKLDETTKLQKSLKHKKKDTSSFSAKKLKL